jgi:hypothetical protein
MQVRETPELRRHPDRTPRACLTLLEASSPAQLGELAARFLRHVLGPQA